MRKSIVLIISVAVFGLVTYLLFRPLIVWPFGWKPMPPVQPAPITASAEAYPALTELLTKYYATGSYPSLSAAVSINGQIVWSSALGYADLETLSPATRSSQYRIGSSSKTVNATLAAVLVAQGKLDLDAPITRYIDYYPDKGNALTTRQLLSHTAGIRHYGWCFCIPVWDYENTRHFDSVEAAVKTFSGSPLLFEPGTGFAYSSYGTVLSSGVMESAGGDTYLSLVASQVIQPLGLTGLSPDDKTIPNDRRVRFYELVDGNYRNALPTDDSIKWAGGGFVATPKDMVKLGSIWMKGAYIPEAVRANFLTPQTLKDGSTNPQNYALGWRIGEMEQDNQKIRIVHHNGTAKGSSSSFMLFPDYGMAVSVMTNKGTQGGDPFHGFAQEMGLRVLKADAGN